MTPTISALKAEKEKKVSELITAIGMFFAFSTQQFHDNKTPLQDGDKYVHLFAGAYIPKSKVGSYLSGMDEIKKWYKAAVKDSKLRKANIEYELANHEAYYTGDIEDTLNTLGSDYTAAEVRTVFNETQSNHE